MPSPSRRLLRRAVPALLAALFWASLGRMQPGVSAHHSFAETYLMDNPVTLKGELVAFYFRNPHCSLELKASDATGRMQVWWIEWGGASQLKAFQRDTLKPGDVLEVTAYRSRFPGERKARLKTLLRPSDGLFWGGYLD